MSRHTDLVNKLVKANRITMEHLLELEDKLWERMEDLDPKYYEKQLNGLEDCLYYINLEEAKEIVRRMRPYGEYWNYETVKSFLAQKGQSDMIEEFYIAMNMAKNDYTETARVYGVEDDAEFYYSIAKDFIYDEDARPHKVAKYFM